MTQPLPFGSYMLLDRIAVGGMAEVFVAARPDKPGRLWALKRILPGLVEDREFVAMFVDEARIASQVRHPNVSRTDDLGRQDGVYFIAMEYVSGLDLRTVLERARPRGLPIPVTLRLIIQVCAGLDAAHRKTGPSGQPLGIIHRDVSPQNVLVSFAGDVKLIDFGVAKAADRLQRTEVGVLKGKYAYMSPEQAQGGDLDRRSDVFACGVLLYELLTGEKPFAGESDFETLRNVRAGRFKAVRSLRTDVSPELEEAVTRALAVDREARLGWCSELQSLLQAELSRTSAGPGELRDWVRTTLAAEAAREEQRLERWRSLASQAESAAATLPEAPHRPDPTPVASSPATDRRPGPAPEQATAVLDLSSQATQAVSLSSLGASHGASPTPAPPARPRRQEETAVGPAPKAPPRMTARPPASGTAGRAKGTRVAIAVLAVLIAAVFGVGAWRKMHPTPAEDAAALADAPDEAPEAAAPSEEPKPAAPPADTKVDTPEAPALARPVAEAAPVARPAARPPVAPPPPPPAPKASAKPPPAAKAEPSRPPVPAAPPAPAPAPATATGRLAAMCQPSGVLVVDGRSTGRATPITKGNALELPVGRHMVSCDIDGTLTEPQQVDIAPDETATFRARLP